MWSASGLGNESDVEQKFIWPLLTAAHPTGMGIPPEVISTKKNLRSFAIGKGSDLKVYYPDYVIANLGMPLAVIEAKSPSESVEEGYRQARLYATELNSLYPSGTSPTKYVVACNGTELWFGLWDSASPSVQTKCEALGQYAPEIAELANLIGWRNLKKYSERLAENLRSREIYKPRRMVGGAALQNEEVGQNSFGETLTVLISPVFNPMTMADRANIARKAYVPSRRRERYIDPIDRVIRAALPPSETQSTLVEDTGKPQKVLDKLGDLKNLEHKVLLLIGSVGSGKSTFVDYLKEVALPDNLRDKLLWCRLNMNIAPVSRAEIYPWLRHGIVTACKASLPDLDFDDLDVIRKLFGIEINAFERGIGKLYAHDFTVHAVKLAEEIAKCQNDPVVATNAYVRFTCAQRGKLLIIVLDNCDKKQRDEQLLMFEVAQWLQNEFRSLVILPLRDETFDNHRSEKPLDTALKDLVFRIEPPLFQNVLMRRVQVALHEMDVHSNEKLSYRLSNGMKVEYPRTEQAFYLSSIVRSILDHDSFARRMIVGLAGRDMRRALEIFLEFCRSAYIGDDQIFKMRQSEGTYVLPIHQVATVLIRMNRRFYDSDHSYVKNLFASGVDDPLPCYFSRYLILRWMRERFRQVGPSGLQGYFKKLEVKHALIPYGMSPELLDREFNYLLSARCIIAEHLRTDFIEDGDLARLGPAGFVHLDLLNNVNYLAAVAEDTNFVSRELAEGVANRIRDLDDHLHVSSAVANATAAVDHLSSMLKSAAPHGGGYVQDDLLASLDNLRAARDAIHRVKKSHHDDAWFDIRERMPVGSRHSCVVANITRHGYFVDFDNGLSGLIYSDRAGGMTPNIGDRVLVEILRLNLATKKIGLRLISILAEDSGDAIAPELSTI